MKMKLPLIPKFHMQGILRVQLCRLGLTSNGDASLTMRLRTVLSNPMSLRRVGRRDQIVKCFERQHVVSLPGTPLSTVTWHQTCVSGKLFFVDWGETSGSGGGVSRSLDRPEHQSLQQV